MIRAVLIDLDGVVRQWEPWVPDDGSPVTAEVLRAIAFEDASLDGVVTGAMTHEEWVEHVAVALEDRFGPEGRRAAESWSAPIGTVKEDTLALVRELRNIVPVALISNATSRLESDLTSLALIDDFDLIVNSSRVGAAKPDERIFRHAAEQLGVALDECLFIDDTAGHVEGAAKLGLRTIHFTDAAALRAALAAFGLVSADPAHRNLELLIRTAHADEAAEIAELHLRTALHAYEEIFPPEAPPPTLPELTSTWRGHLREQTAFVAVVDNRIVGVALVGADSGESGAAHLSRVYVAPELAGRGIGTRLYGACLERIAAAGFAAATLWVLEKNTRVRGWYERLGWVATGERKAVYEPAGIDDLRYRLTSI